MLGICLSLCIIQSIICGPIFVKLPEDFRLGKKNSGLHFKHYLPKVGGGGLRPFLGCITVVHMSYIDAAYC